MHTPVSPASESRDPWPGDWLRGVLELCVLRTLEAGPSYGYEIGQTLRERGLGEVRGGTLYPLLKRLETAELVSVEWRAGEGGPGRKYYALTLPGQMQLSGLAADWQRFSATVGRFAGAEVTADALGAERAPGAAS